MDLIDYLEREAVGGCAAWRFDASAGTTGEDALAANLALNGLLETRPTMICMIVAPDGGESEQPDDAPDGPGPDDDTSDEDASERDARS